ncbi:MAG: FAD-binding oxidoreductase [Rhodobacteraceae bacterium]|nr:FAD-binding oxidoreductase [Paracoccaceae bacterium]
MNVATTPDRLLEALAGALGPAGLRTGAEIAARNCADAYGAAPTPPRAVALPRDTKGVSAVLRLCNAAGAPVVVQGGMTGLAMGAHPEPGEIALSLERMSGVEEVDRAASTLTALAGTPLEQVQQAAAEAGLMCGIDLGARGSCSIGGNVATNAGGNQVLRYGMARRNVLGLEVVQPDGTVLRGLNKMLKNNAGYDWTQLYIGSEGTLGVITRVVLGLHPRPEGVQTALCAVPDAASALELLGRLERRFGAGLQVFEAMWSEFLDLATGPLGLSRPFAEPPDLAVLVEVAMGPGEGATEAFAEGLGALLEEGVLADAVLAQSEQDRARLWAYRESPYEYGQLGRVGVNFDISIPRARMAEAVTGLRELRAAHWPGDPCGIFGHLADSNLHYIALIPPDEKNRQGSIDAAVYGLVRDLGGSVSAEHGIGKGKRDWLHYTRTPEELALMRQLKAALDPKGILNPGRVLR